MTNIEKFKRVAAIAKQQNNADMRHEDKGESALTEFYGIKQKDGPLFRLEEISEAGHENVLTLCRCASDHFLGVALGFALLRNGEVIFLGDEGEKAEGQTWLNQLHASLTNG